MTSCRRSKTQLAPLLCCLAVFVVGCELEGDDAPAIFWTAMRPHEDRGPCTRCHTRLDLGGNPLPTIRSWSRMPHEDRGVCSNCHRITVRAGSGEAKRGAAQGAWTDTVLQTGATVLPSPPGVTAPSSSAPSRF